MPGVLQSIYGGLTGEGTANQQTAFNRDLQAGDDASVQGGALQTAGSGLLNQFGSEYLNQGNLQGGYRGQADTAYGDLSANPGYSATDRAAIQGNPNAGFQYYNPTELQGDTSDYAGNLNRAAQQGQEYLQAGPTNQTTWQGGINKNLETAGGEAVSGIQGGLDTAVGGYGTNLNAAVDPSKLTVGSQLNGYELSPEEAQNIRNVAAQTTQGQYGKMSKQAQLQAEAQGNTSPAALAAIQENLGRQGAIDAGNAASQAELAANQTAANRLLSKTQTNLGANQTLAQLQAQNATNLEGAQSNAANQIYGAKQGTAANQAATETQANESIAANQGTAANAEANLGYNAAQTGGAQKIATDTGLQATGQNLATGADAAASGRAATTANQTKSDQNSVRNYYTGQQGAAQTGQTTAGNQALSAYGGTTSAYGAQTGALNNANAAAGNVATGANSNSQNLQGSFLADGGTVTGPTVGEYDDTTLPKPQRGETPDISHDYREQINTDPIPTSSTSNTSLSLNVGSPSSPAISPNGGYGGGGGIDPAGSGIDPFSGSGYSGGLYSTIGNPGWDGYSGGGGDGYEGPPTFTQNNGGGGDYGPGGASYNPEGGGDEYYYGDGVGGISGQDATIAERGPEAVITTKPPSRYADLGREVVNGLGSLVSVGRMQRQTSTPPTTPSTPQQPAPHAPQSLSSKIANGVSSVLTGHRYFADGGNVGDSGQTALLNAMSTPQGAASTTASRVSGGNASGGNNYQQPASASTYSAGADQPYNPPTYSGGPTQPPANSGGSDQSYNPPSYGGGPTQPPSSGMRGDGSSVPGNEPGGAQGQYGWQGQASQQMANAGQQSNKQSNNVRQSPRQPQYSAQGQASQQQPQFQQPQQRSMRVFTQPTNVKLGGNGTTDTVVPLNPGPNAKVTPSQMGMGGQPQGQSMYRQQAGPQQPPQAAQQSAPRMPSRYRPATGPKGMVGPQQRPMQPMSNARQSQYAAA